MILWETNFELDISKLNEVIESIKSKEQYRTSEYYSTFYESNINFRDEIVFLKDYEKNIIEGLSKLGLHFRMNYSFDHWTQIYVNGGNGHKIHDHYREDTIISWVHFVRPTNQKCFHFFDSEGNKIYPKQNPGDFIMFPSWALHGVDNIENDSEERVTIAGNIWVGKIYSPLSSNGKIENMLATEFYPVKENTTVVSKETEDSFIDWSKFL